MENITTDECVQTKVPQLSHAEKNIKMIGQVLEFFKSNKVN